LKTVYASSHAKKLSKFCDQLREVGIILDLQQWNLTRRLTRFRTKKIFDVGSSFPLKNGPDPDIGVNDQQHLHDSILSNGGYRNPRVDEIF